MVARKEGHSTDQGYIASRNTAQTRKEDQVSSRKNNTKTHQICMTQISQVARSTPEEKYETTTPASNEAHVSSRKENTMTTPARKKAPVSSTKKNPRTSPQPKTKADGGIDEDLELTKLEEKKLMARSEKIITFVTLGRQESQFSQQIASLELQRARLIEEEFTINRRFFVQLASYGHLNIDLRKVRALLNTYLKRRWHSLIPRKFIGEVNGDVPVCPQVCVRYDEPCDDEAAFDGCNIILERYGIQAREIWGDGSCGMYSILLGLYGMNKVQKVVFQDKDSLAATMLTLRFQAANFIRNAGVKIWNQLNQKGNDFGEVHYFMGFQEENIPSSVVSLWNAQLTIDQYLLDLRVFIDEHVSVTGLIAIAALYRITIVIYQQPISPAHGNLVSPENEPKNPPDEDEVSQKCQFDVHREKNAAEQLGIQTVLIDGSNYGNDGWIKVRRDPLIVQPPPEQRNVVQLYQLNGHFLYVYNLPKNTKRTAEQEVDTQPRKKQRYGTPNSVL